MATLIMNWGVVTNLANLHQQLRISINDVNFQILQFDAYRGKVSLLSINFRCREALIGLLDF